MTVRVVATAGHVDHGKSTLVQALTGTDPDRFDEEKRRGLTIDLGFARFTTPSGIEVDLVDVPGHVRFVKNMLAGVGAIDASLFVVAVTERWMPQTEEHLRILELLGVERGVIALTMARLVDDDELELARLDVAERTAGTFLAGAPIVAVDAPADGHGIASLVAALDEVLAGAPETVDRARPRLWVDRSFAIAGAGAVVTGTLAGGSLAVGADVEVVGARGTRTARIRALQAFGEERTSLPPGCRAAVNLAGVPHHAVTRGDAVVRPGQWHLTRQVDASLHVLRTSPRPLRSRGSWLVYVGSGEHAVRLRIIGGGGSVGPGETGAVRLSLPVALPLLPGDRFVLRDTGSGTTVAGGEVLDVDPVLRPSRARPDRSVERVVAERGWIDADDLERLTGEHRTPTVGRWVVDPAAHGELRTTLRQRVEAATPPGLDISALDDRERAVLDADPEVTVAAGRATPTGAADPYLTHPFLAVLAAAPFAPPSPAEAGIRPGEVRELVRRGLVVERDGIVFAPEALERAADEARRLLASSPDGFTVAALRQALGTTRRFAMPLVALLDDRGLTRRRGDLRIAGPRLERTTR